MDTKISFSLPPRSKSKVMPISDTSDAADDEEGSVKEFVTKFDPSETLTNSKPKYVIPPLLPDRRRQFETEIPSAVSDNVTYGLNLRQRVPRTEPVEQIILKSLRYDMKSLPDAPELEDYESFPVEGYGEALLAGYGWKPGQGIGRNAEKDVGIVEYHKRNGYEGIGFKESDRKIAKVDVGKEVYSTSMAMLLTIVASIYLHWSFSWCASDISDDVTPYNMISNLSIDSEFV